MANSPGWVKDVCHLVLSQPSHSTNSPHHHHHRGRDGGLYCIACLQWQIWRTCATRTRASHCGKLRSNEISRERWSWSKFPCTQLIRVICVVLGEKKNSFGVRAMHPSIGHGVQFVTFLGGERNSNWRGHDFHRRIIFFLGTCFTACLLACCDTRWGGREHWTDERCVGILGASARRRPTEKWLGIGHGRCGHMHEIFRCMIK